VKPSPRRRPRKPVRRIHAILTRFSPAERALVGRAAAAEARAPAQFVRVATMERAARVCAADRLPAARA